MRYVIQLLVPALVVIIVALVFMRNRGATSHASAGDPAQAPPRILGTGTFVVILIVAAAFTVALVYELQGFHH